jgi:murein DD-endopeptidase MepM/ murein hydrolase activator NlpD
MEAIQSIIAGKGEETLVGEINLGGRIASIIIGTSACSTGTHLHFEVANNGANVNPASLLKSQDVDWDLCGWYGCDSPFSFSGSWDWPVNGRPRVTQGYGMTAYARSGAYGGREHSGLDMVSEDLMIKAVKEGKLYRGSIACGGGTLRYVRVEHKEDGYDTYYLHVNYY